MMGPEFWLMLCFVALMMCIYKPVKKSILSYIDREILRIQSDIDSARELKLAMEANVHNLQKQLNQIKIDRANAVNSAKAHANQTAQDNAKELEMLIEHKEQDALYQLEYIKTTAIANLRNSLTENAQRLIQVYLVKHNQDFGTDVSIANHLMNRS